MAEKKFLGRSQGQASKSQAANRARVDLAEKIAEEGYTPHGPVRIVQVWQREKDNKWSAVVEQRATKPGG